jgi:hypothetical protein
VIAVVLGIVLAGVGFVVLRGPGLEPPPAVNADFGLTPVSVDMPPDWRLEKVGGGHLAMRDLRGHVALLYFWTTW